jgi:rhamnogalacturonan endolyase
MSASNASFVLLMALATFAHGAELGIIRENDRGLVARPADDGRVYLSWRLLATDPEDVAFDVYCETSPTSAGSERSRMKMNDEPICRTTDYLADAPEGRRVQTWFVRATADGKPGDWSRTAALTAKKKPLDCISIKLDGDYTFQKVGIADLDGDGQLDFVIKQPGENIDPYEKYWQRSPDTYKLEAYRHDGTMLWRFDLGWGIERGVWYSPYVVYDLNGDRMAEVAAKTAPGDPRDADGRVRSGPEHLTIRDGRTGRIVTVDWPSREGYGGNDGGYNRASRNQLCVAYLDGKRPSLIVERGTYDLIRFVAYRFDGERLEEQWRWDTTQAVGYAGQGAHGMHAADVDGDGRDEIVYGSAVLDDNGKPLWKTGLGHPDHLYVGDIDPDHPGLEIYYGIETRKPKGNGMCLVDAKTGEILWGIDEPTRHVHGQGMASDIDAAHPGSECYSAESDPSRGKSLAWARLHSAQGKLLSSEARGGYSPRAALWDADPQRELVIDRRITNYGSDKPLLKIEGTLVAVADVLGDWREEIITSVPGEMRIYVTTVAAKDRRVWLMEDRLYRMDVVAGAMGYYQTPMTSDDLVTGQHRR